MENNDLHLDVIQESAIREISNIGLGNAITALSSLTGKPFNMSVPSADSMRSSDILKILGGDESVAVGVLMPIEGDLTGHMGLLFPWEAAHGLWKMLLGTNPEDVTGVDELYASAFLEVGNIINSCFLNAISDMTNYSLHATPPLMAVEMSAAILASMMSVASQEDGVALTIRTRIFDEDDSFDGVFLYVPCAHSLNKLFTALGLGEVAA